MWAEALAAQVPAATLEGAGLAVRRDSGTRPLTEWLRFGGIGLDTLAPWLPAGLEARDEVGQELAEDAAYAPYLARQDSELRELRASEAVHLGPDFPYAGVPGLSNEMTERLSGARPENLAAAGRVAGITPAALSAVLVFARRRQRQAA